MTAGASTLFGPKWSLGGGAKIQVYAKAGIAGNFSGGTDSSFAGADLSEKFGGGAIYEVGVGANFRSGARICRSIWTCWKKSEKTARKYPVFSASDTVFDHLVAKSGSRPDVGKILFCQRADSDMAVYFLAGIC